MAAPALRIPLSYDLDEFERSTQKARAAVDTTVKFIARQFASANTAAVGAIGGAGAAATTGLAQSAVRAGLAAAGMATAYVGAAALIGSAIVAARAELERMVEIADKSARAGISAEFFQNFIAGAKGAEDQVRLLETALDRAFQATKQRLNPDWTVFDQGLTKVTAVEQAMRDLRELFDTTQQTFTGLDLFRGAATQDDRIKAVLTAMRELEAIGQRAAALDLGEKMFGAEAIDQVRRGLLSIEDILKRVTEGSGDIVSNTQVLQAKQLDDRLGDAWRTVTQNLSPAMTDLAGVALNFKNLWVAIVEVIAQASGYARVLQDIIIKTLDNMRVIPGLGGVIATALAAARAPGLAPNAQLRIDETFSGLRSDQAAFAPVLPRRRPDEAPQPGEAATGGRDFFDRAADTIQRRTAALQIEASMIDATTSARERARIVAELETVAVQANLAAGKESTAVTAEQRDRINQVADAYGRAADAIEKARSPLAAFARESANVDKALNQFAASSLNTITDDLADVVTMTKSVQDAFKDMANSILRDLARIVIRQAVTGPIAAQLGSTFGFSGGFDTGYSGNILPQPRAAGGAVDPSQVYMVGERGPELFVPDTPGQIVPNGVAQASALGGGGGGDVSVNVFNAPAGSTADVRTSRDASGGMRLDITLRDVENGLAGRMAGGQSSLNRVIEGRYGLDPTRGLA